MHWVTPLKQEATGGRQDSEGTPAALGQRGRLWKSDVK